MGQISPKPGNHLKEWRAKKTFSSEISEFLCWARNVSLVWAVFKAKKVETSTIGGVDKKKKDDNTKTVPLSLKGNKSCSLFLPLQPGTKREIQSEGGWDRVADPNTRPAAAVLDFAIVVAFIVVAAKRVPAAAGGRSDKPLEAGGGIVAAWAREIQCCKRVTGRTQPIPHLYLLLQL